jgi:hypothetical protein
MNGNSLNCLIEAEDVMKTQTLRRKKGQSTFSSLPRTKKRILIVNCFFDEMRFTIWKNIQVPQAMGPVYLSGAFSPHTGKIRLYSEMYSGSLEDEKLPSWPDMLVLTGTNTAFDRTLHLTAYARTKNKKIIAVAGEPATGYFRHIQKDILMMHVSAILKNYGKW